MTGDWRVVFESLYRGDCADRALVLAAAGIPHELLRDATGWALVVPAEVSARAAEELSLYDAENPDRKPAPRPVIVYYDALPGIFAYTLVLAIVTWLAGTAALTARSFAPANGGACLPH